MPIISGSFDGLVCQIENFFEVVVDMAYISG